MRARVAVRSAPRAARQNQSAAQQRTTSQISTKSNRTLSNSQKPQRVAAVTTTQKRAASSTPSDALLHTALNKFHKSLGAQMVPFCGWEMPLQFKEGILNSHLHTRNKAGLFDVSHMGQLFLRGKDRVEFIESLVVGDIAALKEGQATLSLFTTEQGGIIDDTIITSDKDHLYVVVNAACADKDIAHIKNHMKAFKAKGKDVDLEVSEDLSLLALQGPSAVGVLQALGSDFSTLPFMSRAIADIKGVGECRVTRCGYTGEDGFEISVPSKKAVDLAELLLKNPDVLSIGLGARDSLRLEAGLCLYGNDMDETTSPVEASLLWTVGKRRREKGGYLGSDAVSKHIKEGVQKKRVGVIVETGIARPGAASALKDAKGTEIGTLCSGGYSPLLKKGVGMAYVKTSSAKEGTPLEITVRDKASKVTVSKMPFVPHHYFKGAK